MQGLSNKFLGELDRNAGLVEMGERFEEEWWWWWCCCPPVGVARDQDGPAGLYAPGPGLSVDGCVVVSFQECMHVPHVRIATAAVYKRNVECRSPWQRVRPSATQHGRTS